MAVSSHEHEGHPVQPASGIGGMQFTTTHWTVVLAARESNNKAGADALEALCRTYWYPLYAFVRRRGYGPHDAQDLTQEFFARLLKNDFLRDVDPQKGKFRSFLLAAMEHFLANEWRHAHAQKRGGSFSFVSLNDTSAEGRYADVRASDFSPKQIFEQQWALTLLETVILRLRNEFAGAGKAAMFEELKIFLTGEKRSAGYPELAARLQTTEAALKMAVSRLRQRYSEVLRAEIANTVETPAEIEEELRALLTALREAAGKSF